MPKLTDHQSNEFTKVLLAGDAMSGKTGSLVSLVAAGYHLRIMDFDNKLDILKQMVMRECPDKAENVDFVTLRDKFKAGPQGPVLDGAPKAFPTAMKYLDNWPEYGKPSEWGPNAILVIDSLSRLCDAAFDFNMAVMPPKLSADPRAVYGAAQDATETVLATLTSEGFKTNVIVIAHVLYMELPDGSTKGFPQGVGQKLSPKIPQYFPSYVLYTNKGGKRRIVTASTPLVDLANPAPFKIEKEYPIETGLADIFAALRDAPQAPVEKPKTLTLQRRS